MTGPTASPLFRPVACQFQIFAQLQRHCLEERMECDVPKCRVMVQTAVSGSPFTLREISLRVKPFCWCVLFLQLRQLTRLGLYFTISTSVFQCDQNLFPTHALCFEKVLLLYSYFQWLHLQAKCDKVTIQSLEILLRNQRGAPACMSQQLLSFGLTDETGYLPEQ